MKWQDRPQSTNVEVDCLGFRTSDLEAGFECQEAVKRLREEFSSTPRLFENLKMHFDLGRDSTIADTPDYLLTGESEDQDDELPGLSLVDTPAERLEQFKEALEEEVEDTNLIGRLLGIY